MSDNLHHSPEEIFRKEARLRKRLEAGLSTPTQQMVIASEIFEPILKGPQPHAMLSVTSCMANEVFDSPLLEKARNHTEAGQRSRETNVGQGMETQRAIQAVLEDILAKNPTLSVNSLATLVVQRLGYPGHSTARRHISKLLEKSAHRRR